jgi:hypothetical protein
MIRLQPPGQPLPHRFARGLPQRSPKRSRTGLGARKSQRQLTLLRLRSRQSCLELERPWAQRAPLLSCPRWNGHAGSRNLACDNLGPARFPKIASAN